MELDNIINPIIAHLEEKNKARDTALTESRAIIRLAALSIRATHRQEWTLAQEQLEKGRERLVTLKTSLEKYPELYWAGYVQDSQKEYSEARLTYALVKGEPLPLPGELAVEDAAYLNGLAEAASELRRYILDILRHGSQNAEQAEILLDKIDEIYSRLTTIDFPDMLTGGLRRTTDQLRGVLERTRGDLTLTLRQQELESKIEQAVQLLGKSPTGV